MSVPLRGYRLVSFLAGSEPVAAIGLRSHSGMHQSLLSYWFTRLSAGCLGCKKTGAMPPICGEQGFLADLNETRAPECPSC
jgi:hypothetical protein